MVIAVNGRCLQRPESRTGNYAYCLLLQLAAQHPQQEWLVVSDVALTISLPVTVKTVITGKQITGTYALQHWLRKTLPAVMRQHQAKAIMSFDGTTITDGDAIAVTGFTGETVLPQPNGWLPQIRMKRILRKAVERSSLLFATSQPLAERLAKSFLKNADSIPVIPSPAPAFFTPLEWEQKINVREEFTNEKEFFLFTQGFEQPEQLLNVLKAFSVFKKWQLSDMKLVITGDMTDHKGDMQEKLNAYRFKADVVLLGQVAPEQLHRLMAASYAVLFTPSANVVGLPVLAAMQSGTAVISAAEMDAAWGDDVIFHAAETDAESISRQLILVYKDEAMRSRHIQAGIAMAATFSWETAAQKLWQAMEKYLPADYS